MSRLILEAFLDGRITRQDFLWGFHLPNSDYLPVAACIVQALAAAAEANRTLQP